MALRDSTDSHRCRRRSVRRLASQASGLHGLPVAGTNGFVEQSIQHLVIGPRLTLNGQGERGWHLRLAAHRPALADWEGCLGALWAAFAHASDLVRCDSVKLGGRSQHLLHRKPPLHQTREPRRSQWGRRLHRSCLWPTKSRSRPRCEKDPVAPLCRPWSLMAGGQLPCKRIRCLGRYGCRGGSRRGIPCLLSEGCCGLIVQRQDLGSL